MNSNEKMYSGYIIEYTKVADKFFKQHEEIRIQYEDAIKQLITGDNPESIDQKLIKGKRSKYYRIRIGNYRVIYTIINGMIIVVTTILAGPRGDVYKKMDGLK